MILVNSGAFLSISSWFCELTELIFVMIPYISSTGYPPKTQGIMGHVQVANQVLNLKQMNFTNYPRLLSNASQLAIQVPRIKDIMKRKRENVFLKILKTDVV